MTARPCTPSSTRATYATSASYGTAPPWCSRRSTPAAASGSTSTGPPGRARCGSRRRRARGVPDRDPRRRPRPCQVRLPPLDQLPLGGGARHRLPGPRRRRAGRGPRRDRRPRDTRPLRRLAAAEREGTRRDRRDTPRPGRGLRQAPRRRTQRGARGPRTPHWSGVVPVVTSYGTPERAEIPGQDLPLPGYLPPAPRRR